ncbi:MAG TPA: FliG C-terminal domain-containing protein [Pirellulaceae bacterium]|nr:FliG C-terminal domain-containing protein [Pirellulaceae bacterium]
MLPAALRKAAILISGLDDRAADALLEEMGPEQAAKVRSAIMQLDEIDAAEEQRVLAEFFERQNAPARGSAKDVEADGVVLELSSPEIPPESRAVPAAAESPATTTDEFLAAAEAEQLANVLNDEHPQTVAVIVAHLAPQRAAAVLERLPANLATEALERMASLGPVDRSVLDEIERGLERRLVWRFGAMVSGGQSARRLGEVLDAMDFRQRERILLQLAERNASLAGSIPNSPSKQTSTSESQFTQFRYRLERPNAVPERESRRFKFRDLVRLHDDLLRDVFAAAEPTVVLLALTGAEEPLLKRVLRQLPSQDAALLRERLNHPGPLRLREVEQAQQQLAATAVRLAGSDKEPLV